jgi:hypothetical protein
MKASNHIYKESMVIAYSRTRKNEVLALEIMYCKHYFISGLGKQKAKITSKEEPQAIKNLKKKVVLHLLTLDQG